MTQVAFFPLPGGLRVAAPDSMALITPYVLREQGDWFEDELRFVRRLLRPGDRAVDVGANHGVYALTMARAVGPEGRVWAFEPARATASLLRQSIAENGLSNLELHQAALSDHAGTGRLFLHAQSELNSLRAAGEGGASEEVPLRTLDGCADEQGWGDLALLKLDAEGEEGRILDGGRRLLARRSPLVLFELKHGDAVNLPLLAQLAGLGYQAFRLAPGPCVLVPLPPGAHPDPYWLNAFACKPDRARALEAAGLLAASVPPAPHATGERFAGHLAGLAYARRLFPHLQGFDGALSPGAAAHRRALELEGLARRAELGAGPRYACLQAALEGLAAAPPGEEPVARLQTLARLASAAGLRAAAVELLQTLLAQLVSGEDLRLDEPFLPACARFEEIDPGDRLADWLLAAVLEERERLAAFSSFYARTPQTLEGLAAIERLGFGSEEMARRLRLVRTALGAAPAR